MDTWNPIICTTERTKEVPLWKVLAVIAALLLLGGFVGSIDDEASEVVTAQIVAESAKPAFEYPFSHPLPFTATVTQTGPGIKEARTRYYVPSREAK